MYTDFDTLSFSSMSNSLPSAPKKTSEPGHGERLPTPTSESPRGCEIPAEGDSSKSGGATGEHEGEGARRGLVTDEDCLPEEVVGSSGAAAGRTEPSKGAMTEEGHNGHGTGAADNDDGYHTPTSPRHRIPTDLPCPRAPRKIRRRWQKRKADGDKQVYRAVRRCLRLPGEFQLVLCPAVGDVRPPGRAEDTGADDAVE